MIELMRELRHKVRGMTLRGVWGWLTYGSGVRLIMLTIIIPLILLLAEHYHRFR